MSHTYYCLSQLLQNHSTSLTILQVDLIHIFSQIDKHAHQFYTVRSYINLPLQPSDHSYVPPTISFISFLLRKIARVAFGRQLFAAAFDFRLHIYRIVSELLNRLLLFLQFLCICEWNFTNFLLLNLEIEVWRRS